MKQIHKLNKDILLVRPLLDFKKAQLIKISKLIFGKFFKDPSNRDKKYLRTRIRNLKESLEKSGISYDQIYKSINNLASSRDTLNSYLDNIYKNIVIKKKNKILIKINYLKKLNSEMKMKVFKQSIKDLNNSYYFLRSKKILNLIDHIQKNSQSKYKLGGCAIFTDKNHIVMKKESKNL